MFIYIYFPECHLLRCDVILTWTEYTVSELYRNNSSISQVVAFILACLDEAAYRLSSLRGLTGKARLIGKHISLFGLSCTPIKLTRRFYRESKLHKIICKEQAVHHASYHSETLVDVAARSDPVYVDYEAKCRQYTTLPKTNSRRNGFISVDTDTEFKRWNKQSDGG